MAKLGQGMVGKKLVTGTRTISDGEFAVITYLTGELSRFHTDRTYAQELGFSERILQGPILYSMSMGLEINAGLMRILEELNIRAIAMVGLENVRFFAPVYPNDTIRVETEFLEPASTRRSHRGLGVLRRPHSSKAARR